MSNAPLHDAPGVRRASVLVLLSAATGLFVYEAAKTALLPDLTLWQSHAVTIAFGTVVATLAARRALLAQARLHRRLLREATERARAESAEASLRASETRYRQLVEQSPEAVVVHRGDALLYANPACLALLGAPGPEALTGRALVSWMHPDDHPRLLRRLAALPRTGALEDEGVYRLLALDGEERVVETASVRITHDGAPAVQTVLRDVTQRTRLEAQLVHQTLHDPLTGLANRVLFRDRVEHALARRHRAGSAGERMAVLFVDLDHFKTVNDSLGHAAGDQLLALVARRLDAATRGCDTVARLGGDEFAVLLDDMTHGADAQAVADRVVAAMAAPFTVDRTPVVVGVSVGIATARHADDADALLRNADLALYAAKRSGRARHVAFAPAMHAAAIERLALEADLRPAVLGGTDFALAFQPIVDLASGRMTGVEALLRWSHRARGAVPPDAFIPIAEETGLIVPLGRWVLREACRQLAAWDTRATPALSMSVNVSGRQLQEAAFVDEVRGALAESGLAPERLVLEITESVMMRNADAMRERLQALKALGVRLALDDFGTGYSSLSYLRDFPIDVLKIDKRFVERLGHGDDDSAIAHAIVSLGATLSLLTVAEGIEDAAQLERLRALGCQRGQGYHFSRPLPAAEMQRVLADMPSVCGPRDST